MGLVISPYKYFHSFILVSLISQNSSFLSVTITTGCEVVYWEQEILNGMQQKSLVDKKNFSSFFACTFRIALIKEMFSIH